MATRNTKGSVSITDYRSGYRLRWKIQSQRKELYVPSNVPDALTSAQIIKIAIEQDIREGSYDTSLNRYKQLIEKAALGPLLIQRLPSSPKQQNTSYDLLSLFDDFCISKGQDLDTLTIYYSYTKKMIVRWGNFDVTDTSRLLNSEQYSVSTYNRRRTCLQGFYEWLMRKGYIHENPLAEVPNKRKTKPVERRKPFTDKEAAAILEALKNDTYSKSHTYKHSQYYSFVAFLLHIGCRNGEAIALKVKDVNFDTKEIRIAHSLSRTMKGTHIKARVLKGTKMENIRFIPVDSYLEALLKPLCENKQTDEYVFLNKNGNPIDDRMFQRRIFRPVLKELKIEIRDLYACRHTFATRAVRAGMKPHEVAYIMGDTVATVLKNYFHNHQKPGSLPPSIC